MTPVGPGEHVEVTGDVLALEESTLEAVVRFLQEFDEAGVDPLWSVTQLRWKLGGSASGMLGALAWWVVDDDVVATLSLTLRRFWHRDEVIVVGELGDGYTAPSHRRRGLFGRLYRALEQHVQGVDYVYGTPNELSASPMLRDLGFSAVPRRLLSVEREPAYRQAPSALWTELDLERAEGELDQLARSQAPAACSIVRDARHVRERFGSPLARYERWELRIDARLVGVAVLRPQVVLAGRRDLTIADWLFQDEADGVAQLAAHALDRGAHLGVDLVTAWVCEGGAAAAPLAEAGFRTVWASSLLVSQTAAGIAVLEDRRPFPFTMAASDNV